MTVFAKHILQNITFRISLASLGLATTVEHLCKLPRAILAV